MRDIDRRLLHEAGQGFEDGVKKCLEEGADVNVKENDFYGETPLHLAAGSGSEGCCRILLDFKASVRAVDDRGDTPLHRAARSGSEGCCRMLLDFKAFVNAVNEFHQTPLHCVAIFGYEGCSRTLLDYKAYANVVDHKEGEHAFDQLSSDIKRRRVQQEYEKCTLNNKLMAEGSSPVDVIKVFLCGNPSDGKTTIKKTLTKKFSMLSMIRSMFATSSKKEEEEATREYSKTPGIDVGKQSVKGVGQFLFWDCAGQTEYSITHGMFMGTGQSFFVVLYNLEELAKGQPPSTKYWLPFIKATRGQNDKPHVILVGSHLDKLQNKQNALRAAEKLHHQSQEMFADTLAINDELIILDARKEDSEGMERLKNVLKRRRKEMIGTERLPKICDEMQKMLKSWREEDVPVFSWRQYFERVKRDFIGIGEDTLRSATKYLHIMGEVYLAEFAEKEDQVILNTEWFTSEIIGHAFAGKEFAAQFQTLPNQPLYTLQELRDFFTKKMDTAQLLALLIHMDLIHETSDKRYLIPGKLPDDSPVIDWDTQRVYDVKGRSIDCMDETDMFNPNVFPCVQKKILDECKARGSTVDISRSSIKFSMGLIEVLVSLTKLKRSINIAVMSPDKESVEIFYNSFQHIVELIQLELADRSPGTKLRESYISQVSLRAGSDLENVVTYTKEVLLEAEEKGQCVGRKGKPEEVTTILFQGYDKMFLQEFGLECRYEWLPIKTVTRCFGRLDRISDWEEDYRTVGKVLLIPSHVVDQIAEDSKSQKESATDNILKKWCRDNNRKMTIGMLHKLLSRLSLVANEDALMAIKEVTETYPNKNCHGEMGDSAIEIGVSEYLARWRLVLKRKWSVLTADLDPNMLTSRLLVYLPEPFCRVVEGAKSEDIKQRIKNSEKLLLLLLQREEEDWPKDLTDGLRETDQRPLAQALQEEYQKVVTEEMLREQKGTRF